MACLIASEVLNGHRNIFRHFKHQRSEVFSSKIFGSDHSKTFLEISVMTRHKSYAFDVEKVGRKINTKFFEWGLSSAHNKVIYKACCFFVKVREVKNLNNLANIDWFMVFKFSAIVITSKRTLPENYSPMHCKLFKYIMYVHVIYISKRLVPSTTRGYKECLVVAF